MANRIPERVLSRALRRRGIALGVSLLMFTAAHPAMAGGGPDPDGLPVTTVSWGNPFVLAFAQLALLSTPTVWRWLRRSR